MNDELRSQVEKLASELVSTARVMLSAGSTDRAAALATAASQCVSELSWMSTSAEEESKHRQRLLENYEALRKQHEELKAAVMPVAEQAASCIVSSMPDEDVFRYGSGRAENVSCGAIRRLCRALGMEVPDAPA